MRDQFCAHTSRSYHSSKQVQCLEKREAELNSVLISRQLTIDELHKSEAQRIEQYKLLKETLSETQKEVDQLKQQVFILILMVLYLL